jgi:hypothetical protein
MFDFSDDTGNGNTNNLRFRQNVLKNNTMNGNVNNLIKEKDKSKIFILIFLL